MDFESVRQRYMPNKVKYLLIAEAPPKADSNRFFYCEDVRNGDTLFLETMKVLYPEECSYIKSVRHRKSQFLKRFQQDGFYLIDSIEIPINKSKKRGQISESLPFLIEKIKSLVSEETNIILISSTVYECCYNELRSKGFNVINKSAIPFPIRW